MYRKNPTFCLYGHEFAVVGKTPQGVCHACERNRRKIYRETHPRTVRNAHYRAKFGITLEKYNDLFAEQKGLCLGCYKHQSSLKRAFAVDHSHATGKIRGLLCINCNVALGNAQDDSVILRRLADYLEKQGELK